MATIKIDTSTIQMTDAERKAAIAYKNSIIDRLTGDAQKRARKKEPSLAFLKKRTLELTTAPQTLERPKAELKKPTDADLLSKEECICIKLLTSGYVDSFSDFFKITHPKAPGSYHYDYWHNIEQGDTAPPPPPPVVPPEKYDFIQDRLIQAENARRSAKDAELAKAYTDLSQYFQSINDMKIAIIPCGYMDGVNMQVGKDMFRFIDKARYLFGDLKSLFKKQSLTVEVAGKICNIVGTVGTYHVAVDITNEQINVGDIAVFKLYPGYVDSSIAREYR